MDSRFGAVVLVIAAALAFASCRAPGPGGDDDDDGATFTPTATPSPLPNDGALAFDGVDDYVRGNEAIELNDLSAVTVEAWVKPAAGATGERAAVAKLSAATRQSWALLRRSNAAAAAAIGGPSIDCAVDAGANIPDGVWTHVAMTWNDGTQIPSVYVNGALQGTAACSTPIAWVLSPLGIGASFENDGTVVNRFWSGLIDEVRIWNVERSAAQILANKDRSLNATPAGNLIASFRFEEGAGDTASGGPAVTGQLGSTTAADAADPAWSADTPF